MQLAERLGLVARAQRLVDDALADVEPELLRHQLRVMVAQGLIGASGFTLAQLPTELSESMIKQLGAQARAPSGSLGPLSIA